MSLNDTFERFLASEAEDERLHYLEDFISEAAVSRGASDLKLWHILASYPTKLELVRLAASLSVSKNPDNTWPVASRLMLEPDQDVVGNTLNSITFSNHRSLGHRALQLFRLRERPQRILYCLARYAEEAIDRRFARHIASFMQSDLSDAFLARSFNALFKLGQIDRLAIKVAMDLVASHVDATNMDRKAAVSAIVYLCFAGNQEDLEILKDFQNKVTIPELRRLLNWGLYELNGFEMLDFNADAAQNFLKRAANLAEPNFTGYGCFEQSEMLAGCRAYLNTIEPENYASVTRTILALGNAELIDELADHREIGLKAIQDRNFGDLKLLWKHYLPSHSERFVGHIRNPDSLEYWNEHDTEMLNVVLESRDFIDGPWQQKFEKCAAASSPRAIDVLVAQLFALEKERLGLADFGDNPAESLDTEQACSRIEAMESLIEKNLFSLIPNFGDERQSRELSQTRNRENLSYTMTRVIQYGSFEQKFIERIYAKLESVPLDASLLADSLKAHESRGDWLVDLGASVLSRLEYELASPNIPLQDCITWVCTTACALLHIGLRGDIAGDKNSFASLLSRFEAIAKKLQAMIDTIDASVAEPESDTEASPDDWSPAIKDRPLVRWNSVLQVSTRGDLSQDEIVGHEHALRDAMKVAPHVEKRWVISSLVKLGTDDAIKAILYQALQHVDSEFVTHSIRQLLKSPHRRAQQALIRSVGRNSISDDLKLTILDEMLLENPQDLLSELKTLEILRLPAHIDDAIRDAVGRVASLTGNIEQQGLDKSGEKTRNSPVSSDVDATIKGLLPDADLLSVDVRSALRTAEMILIQSKDWGNEAVDLSPIVNMHCKAVELMLRETFEGMTDSIIRRGELSRKLDILGYARPIPEKMQIFEDYLAQLPIVRSIPYFSKFKLRKMLRAVCLYRPGKRFTLDGPKAFALLFLVASRRECPFGLAQTIPLTFKSDLELFEFIKIVHSLQDSRNRAVHEGLTWEAKDEIDSLRSQAYQIIRYCIRFSLELRKRGSRPLTGLVGVGA